MRARIAVFGPTAVGKTKFAIELARKVGGEIVNADAVQLYRGFDRGSAKPSLAEQGGVAHHLLDIADPEMPVSVALYQEIAEKVMVEIERRGAVPIVTGGSGLFLRAAMGEWDDFGAPPNPEVRRWAASVDVAQVCDRAMSVDPAAAGRLSPGDRPRLVRVIERALSPRTTASRGLRARFLKIGLQRPRPELYARIDARAALLFPALSEETPRLIARGEAAEVLVRRTLGYREAARAMDGELSPEEALAVLRQGTRRLAKRQLSWWRGEANAIWVRPDDGIGQLGPTLVGHCSR